MTADVAAQVRKFGRNIWRIETRVDAETEAMVMSLVKSAGVTRAAYLRLLLLAHVHGQGRLLRLQQQEEEDDD